MSNHATSMNRKVIIMPRTMRKERDDINAQGSTNLYDLAGRINQEFAQISWAEQLASDHRLAAGRLLAQAREITGRGAPFENWCATNIQRSRADIYKCIALTETPEPTVARAQEKRKARVGMAATRAKQKAAAASRAKVAEAAKAEAQTIADRITASAQTIEEVLQAEEGQLTWSITKDEEPWTERVLGLDACDLAGAIEKLSVMITPCFEHARTAYVSRNADALREAGDMITQVVMEYFTYLRASQNNIPRPQQTVAENVARRRARREAEGKRPIGRPRKVVAP